MSIKEGVEISTFKVYALLHRYANSSASKGKPWHKRSDLSGLCEIGAKALQKNLFKMGITSIVRFGHFDCQQSGGNGKRIIPKFNKSNKKEDSTIPHFWVEVTIGKKELICDPTNKQFSNLLHPHPNHRPQCPLIAWKSSKYASSYIPVKG